MLGARARSERRVMLKARREPRQSAHDEKDRSRKRDYNVGQRPYFRVSNEITNGPDEGVCKAKEQDGGADQEKGDQDDESAPRADSTQGEEKQPEDHPSKAEPKDQLYGLGHRSSPITIRTCRAGERVFGATLGAVCG